MEIIQIEIKNKNALTILKGMEKAQIIRLLKSKKKAGFKVSSFRGVLTSEKAIELAKQVDQQREEWNSTNI